MTPINDYMKRESTPAPMIIDLSNEPDTPPQAKKEPGTPRNTVDLTQTSPDSKPSIRRSPFPTTPSAPHQDYDSLYSRDAPSGDFDRSVLYSRRDGVTPAASPRPAPAMPASSDELGKAPPINIIPQGPVTLSEEQQRILDTVLAGESLFFTGSAGVLDPGPTGDIINALLIRMLIPRYRKVSSSP